MSGLTSFTNDYRLVRRGDEYVLQRRVRYERQFKDDDFVAYELVWEDLPTEVEGEK